MRPSTTARAGAALLLAMMLALAGCAGGRSSDIAYAPQGFDVPPNPLFAENPDYRLGPDDVVSVTVYRAPELTGDYRVDAVGNIMMPLVGQIPARGLTVTELAGALRQNLGSRYYVNPDVSVALKEATSQRVTIDGSVGSPGLYPVRGRTTLMQAVAMAGGASQNANLRRVVIFRNIEGQRMVAAFDLHEIRAARMEDPAVYASDIVIVDGNETRQMWRDVLSTIPVLALFRPFVL